MPTRMHVRVSFLNPKKTQKMTNMQTQKQPQSTGENQLFEGKQIRGCVENSGVYVIKRALKRSVWYGVYQIKESKWTGLKFLKMAYPEVSVDKKKEVWEWKLEPGQYLVVERIERNEKRYDLYIWYLTVETNKACWQFWSKTWVSDVLDIKPMLESILEKRYR